MDEEAGSNESFENSEIADIIFPSNWPEVGSANYQQPTTPPVVGVAVKTPISVPTPETARSNLSQPVYMMSETATAVYNGNPYNINPEIGETVHEPFPTPLGVQPHFKDPTENWSWVYGNGGGY